MKKGKHFKGEVLIDFPKEIFDMWAEDRHVIEEFLNSKDRHFFIDADSRIDLDLQQGRILDLYEHITRLTSYSPLYPYVKSEGFYNVIKIYIFWALKEILTSQGINTENKAVARFILSCLSKSNEMVYKFVDDCDRDWLIDQAAYFVRKAVDCFGCPAEITTMCQVFVDIALGNLDANTIADLSYAHFIETNELTEINKFDLI